MKKTRRTLLALAILAVYCNISWTMGNLDYRVAHHTPQTFIEKFQGGPRNILTKSDATVEPTLAADRALETILWPASVALSIVLWVGYGAVVGAAYAYHFLLFAFKLIFMGGLVNAVGGFDIFILLVLGIAAISAGIAGIKTMRKEMKAARGEE